MTIKEMIPGQWYDIPEGREGWFKGIYGKLLDKGVELTFNKDYTKIKKTIWENNRPKLENRHTKK